MHGSSMGPIVSHRGSAARIELSCAAAWKITLHQQAQELFMGSSSHSCGLPMVQSKLQRLLALGFHIDGGHIAITPTSSDQIWKVNYS